MPDPSPLPEPLDLSGPEDLPDLAAALQAADGPAPAVPAAVDAAVVAGARAALRPGRGWWLAPLAAAAAVLAVATLVGRPGATPGPAPASVAAADVDHDGRVDVIDALALARQGVPASEVRAMLAGIVLVGGLPLHDEPPAGPSRFDTIEVWIDAGAEALAAWQVEVAAETGDPSWVGIEGGTRPAFAEAPAYDPRALRGGRLILAGLAAPAEPDALKAGRVRVATLHVEERGGAPRYVVKLMAAARADGTRIPAGVTLARGA